MIIYDYKPKTDTKYDDIIRVVSILNKIKNSMLDSYADRNTFPAFSEFLCLS